jgi:hypothetical protein
MKRLTILALVMLLTPVVSHGTTDDASQSAAPAASLIASLEHHKIEAIAARDPEDPGRYVAALHVPGPLLLVVSAPYPVPVAIDKLIADRKYMDAYLNLQGQVSREGHFFVVDSLANGLARVCESDRPFDSTTIDGVTSVSYDGKWEAQKLTEGEYSGHFARDDARYARMLNVLTTALNQSVTAR